MSGRVIRPAPGDPADPPPLADVDAERDAILERVRNARRWLRSPANDADRAAAQRAVNRHMAHLDYATDRAVSAAIDAATDWSAT